MTINWINVVLGAVTIIVAALNLTTNTNAWITGLLGSLIIITSLWAIFFPRLTAEKETQDKNIIK